MVQLLLLFNAASSLFLSHVLIPIHFLHDHLILSLLLGIPVNNPWSLPSTFLALFLGSVPTLIAPQGLCMGSFFCHISHASGYPDSLPPYFWSVVRFHLIKQGFVATLYKIKTLSSLPYFIFLHSLRPPDRNISVYYVFFYQCACSMGIFCLLFCPQCLAQSKN